MRLGGRRYLNGLRSVVSAIGSSSAFRLALAPRQDVKCELPARPLDPSACLGDPAPDRWVDRPRRRGRCRSGGCSLRPRCAAKARDRHGFSLCSGASRVPGARPEGNGEKPSFRGLRSGGRIKHGHHKRDRDGDRDQREQRVLQRSQPSAPTEPPRASAATLIPSHWSVPFRSRMK